MRQMAVFAIVALEMLVQAQLQPAPSEVHALAEEMLKAGSIPTVQLTSPDGRSHGVIYDAIAVAAVGARRAIEMGVPPASSRAPQLVAIVMFPESCGGAEVPPTAVRVLRGGEVVQPMGVLRFGTGAAATLPGETWPDGARLSLLPAFPWDAITIEADFPESSCGAAHGVSLNLAATPAAPLEPLTPWLAVPAGARGVLSPTSVALRAWIDPSGAARFIEATNGPESLWQTAVDYVGGQRFSPVRINGTPIASAVSFRLGFRAEGGQQAATATSNSRSPEIATRPAPELAGAPGRCAVADDATYGYSTDNPIRVGGEPFEGPARQRAFLSNLRGPAGEAVRFRRLGSVPVGVNAAGGLLDLYEVIHADMEASVRMYMDLYSTGELRAPAGFKCAAPFNIGG